MDADFIRTTSREMQEAMDMTPEEMDRAAHHLLRMHEGNGDASSASSRSPSRNQPQHMMVRSPGAATRGTGGGPLTLAARAASTTSQQPLTLALSTTFSEVDVVHPSRRNKS